MVFPYIYKGFKIKRNEVKGPVIVFKNSFYRWNVPQYGVGGALNDVEDSKGELIEKDGFKDCDSVFYGWTIEMFKLFECLEKKPEILLIGCGSNSFMLPPNIKTFITDMGIQIEAVTTEKASSTFNLMLEEGREVAAALLPNIPTSLEGKVLVDLK